MDLAAMVHFLGDLEVLVLVVLVDLLVLEVPHLDLEDLVFICMDLIL